MAGARCLAASSRNIKYFTVHIYSIGVVSVFGTAPRRLDCKAKINLWSETRAGILQALAFYRCVLFIVFM